MSYARKILNNNGPDMGYLKGWPNWNEKGKLVGGTPKGTPPKVSPVPANKLLDHYAPIEDGVYVDVCFRIFERERQMILGLVRVKDMKVIEYFSIRSQNRNTYYAEIEAATIAARHYPDDTVYCDCIEAVNKLDNPRIKYVNRRRNTLAHGVSRHRRNYVTFLAGISRSD